MKSTIISLIIGLCLSHCVLAASDHQHTDSLPTSVNLSLREVVEKTYERNPQLDVIQARINHSAALSKSAEGLWSSDPSMNISHYNDELMDSDGLQEWEIGMQLPLWLPGQKVARQKTVKLQRAAINAYEPALKLEIAGIVRELLWHIALTKNRMTIAEQEWNIVLKLQQDVKKRVELGDLAQSDLILSQQESLSKEAAFRIARQEYVHAQHRYDMISGLNRLPANFEEVASDDLSITADHPALNASREKTNFSSAQRDQIVLEKRGNPTLFLGTRHERGISSEEGFANAIGLSISIPLGLDTYTNPKLTAAEVDLSENRSQMEIIYRELNIAIQDASRELGSHTWISMSLPAANINYQKETWRCRARLFLWGKPACWS